MNIADAHTLKPLFRASKLSRYDPVLAKFKSKYFVGCVLTDDSDSLPTPEHLDIQWYKPHTAGVGYNRETLFVPTFTNGGAIICDFTHMDDALSLDEFVEKRNSLNCGQWVFKFSKPLPVIVKLLRKRWEEDEETITEEEDEEGTEESEEESEEIPEEKDSDWEGGESGESDWEGGEGGESDWEGGESEESDEVYARVTRSKEKRRSPPSETPTSPKRQKMADGTRDQMSVAKLLNTLPPPTTENKTDAPSYPTEEKKKDVYKQQINDILAHLGRQTRMLCHALNPSEPSCALFLDAEDARTTHTMFNTGGYRLENMFAPNYSQQVVDSIQRNTRALPGKINTPCLLMEEFTLEKADRKFSFVWVDGCGSWKGSGAFSTQASVLNLFRYKLLDSHSVVAYTINMRGKKGNQVSRAHTEMAMSYRQIKMVAEQNGYTVEHKPKLHHVASSHGDLINCGQNFTAYMRVWK
jgi:hypothetical protein